MTDTLTHARTLAQSIAWAVASGHCPIINSDTRPPLEAVGKLIGIHAGLARYYPGSVEWDEFPMRGRTEWASAKLTCGALIGVARLVGVLRQRSPVNDCDFECQSGRGAVWTLVPRQDCDLIRPWAKPGHVLWHFREAVLLPEPIPMRGQQGLWRIITGATRPNEGFVSDAFWALEQWRKARETR